LFKGPNDLDFDAEGNLFFTDPWGTVSAHPG
jgi:sugar lactone lactonase YvrE